MNDINILWSHSWALRLLMSSLMASISVPAIAHTQGDDQPGLINPGPFSCDGTFYHLRAGTGGSFLMGFPEPIVMGGGEASTVWPAPDEAEIDAIALHPGDAFLYGVRTVSSEFLRLDGAGVTLVGEVQTPGGFQGPSAGAFDALGRYYFAGNVGGDLSPGVVFRLDSFEDADPGTAGVQIAIAEAYTLDQALIDIGDFAFGPDGHLYGATQDTVVQMMLTPGMASVNQRTLPASVGTSSSAFFDEAGRFFVYQVAGDSLQQINFGLGSDFSIAALEIGPPVVIIPPPGFSQMDFRAASDGASCARTDRPDVGVGIEGLPDVVAPGQSFAATVTCRSNGPSAASAVSCDAAGGSDTQIVIDNCSPLVGSPLIVGAEMVCDVTVTAPGTAGGSDTPELAAAWQAATDTPSDSNPGNNLADAAIALIDAVDDDFSASPFLVTVGGTTPSVLENDTLGPDSAAPALVQFDWSGSQSCTAIGGCPPLTLNPDGTIDVSVSAFAASYEVPYQICALPLLPGSACDEASVLLEVVAQGDPEDPPRALVSVPATSGIGLLLLFVLVTVLGMRAAGATFRSA